MRRSHAARYDVGRSCPSHRRWRAAAAAAGASVLVAAGLIGCGSEEQRPALVGSLTVFASSSLRAPFKQIRDEFRADHPDVRVRLRFATSRALFARARRGGPRPGAVADVFATSDRTVLHGLLGEGTTTGDPSTAAGFVAGYQAIQLVGTADPALGRAFLRFLYSDGAQRALTSAGLTPIVCQGAIANCMPATLDG